jgi:hypothetical protein
MRFMEMVQYDSLIQPIFGSHRDGEMLIAENEFYKITHTPGTSNSVLIATFNPMDYYTGSDLSWGEQAISSIGYASLGIICKSNCWFPLLKDNFLSEAISSVRAHYDRCLNYGFSMGGYGCIKFSRITRANITFSLSPQYSIEPKDVHGLDERLIHHFKVGVNSDMAIDSADLCGKLVLVFDPFSTQDTWNVEKIVTQSSNVVLLRIPRIGHETIDLVSSKVVIETAFRLLLTGQYDQLHTLLCQQRRLSPRREVNSLVAAYQRFGDAKARPMIEQRRQKMQPFWAQRLTSAITL